jgi:tetratricopeptide (TPR) repeat protein
VKGFLNAYTLVPVNPLLFNIGQAYRRAGDPEKALSYYEKYVSFEPNGAQVAEAKEHIQKLKEDIETAKRDREREDEERRAKEGVEAQARAEAERKKNEALAEQRRRDAATAGKGLRTGGLVVGAAGVVAVGVGVALATGDGSKAAPIALIGAGGAAIVAGTTMFLIGRGKRNKALEEASRTSLIVPHVTGDTVGVAWITSF